MLNNPQTLIGRKEIWICDSHFDCDWVKTRGGKRPAKPPTIFPGVPKSCMKHSKTIPKPTKCNILCKKENGRRFGRKTR